MIDVRVGFFSLLVDALREYVPGKKRSGRVQAAPHQSQYGQGGGGHFGLVPGGRPDSALDLSAREPAGGHPEEVWGGLDYRELYVAQPGQQPQPATYS